PPMGSRSDENWELSIDQILSRPSSSARLSSWALTCSTVGMHRFFVSIFSLFLTPHGVLVLSALDSTMLFFMPAAIDTAVVVMSVRDRDFFWLYPVLAASGSVAGAALTFALGHKV